MPDSDPPIELPRLLLLPVALLLGLFLGPIVGMVYLPYLALSELIRKIGQSWSYLDGWNEWADSGGKSGDAKSGWMLVWIVWATAYFLSAFSWAPVVGLVLGPFVCMWLCVVPDGLDRMLGKGRELLQRFRRMKIKIAEDRDAA